MGTNLVQALLDRGHEVRALVHRSPLAIDHPKLTSVSGSVADQAAMREACRGVHTVFHAAARIKAQWPVLLRRLSKIPDPRNPQKTRPKLTVLM